MANVLFGELARRIVPTALLVVSTFVAGGIPDGGQETVHNEPSGSQGINSPWPYLNCPSEQRIGPGGVRLVPIGIDGQPIYDTVFCFHHQRPKGSGPAE